jgi:RNA-splicing ligase RtcB
MTECREASHGKDVLSWAVQPDEQVWVQSGRAARLPFVESPVALMADAHPGIGATVGSVIATHNAIIPAAVGVDIGCGMVASETDLRAEDLPDLTPLMPLIEQRIPAGVGKGFDRRYDMPAIENVRATLGWPETGITPRQEAVVISQFGTLGAGNHFVEVCTDERSVVWTVLHSGSRGIGNQLARMHIDGARRLMKQRFIHLEDPDLAYLVQGDAEFAAYISDMLWCQRYAFASRAAMNAAVTSSLFEITGHGAVVREINCHHNFTQLEHHHGKDLWITRKGAIRAARGDLGIIPGSMGASTFIVSGIGSTASYASCAHGAGRRMSRKQAKATIAAGTLAGQMAGRVWNSGRSADLVDEAPGAYKDIDQVMAAQADLVTIEHRLSQVFNYKG